MEGPVSSADPLASSLGIPSAVCRKMKGSGLWQIKITSATTEVSVQKHSFAEIFGDSGFAWSMFFICLVAAEMTVQTGTILCLYG